MYNSCYVNFDWMFRFPSGPIIMCDRFSSSCYVRRFNMAPKLEVALRLPFLILIELFLVEDFTGHFESRYCATTVQILVILLFASLFLLSRDQLITFYNYSLFFIDITVVLFLNVDNTVDIYTTINEQGISSLHIGDIIPVLPIIWGAWVFYVISIVMYSKTLHSFKPIVFSISSIPVIARYLYQPSWKHYPSTWLCCCFALSIFLAIEGIYYCIVGIVCDIINSCRIIQWMHRMYGFTILLVFHWRRLRVPTCLIAMFTGLFTYNLLTIVVLINKQLTLLQLLHLCIANTCNSTVSMLACCFLIYKLCGTVLYFIKTCFHGQNAMLNEETAGGPPNGAREGFGFFFLCLYTGLSTCSPSRKLSLLQVIFYLIISALVRSMFEVVEPILLALPAQQTGGLKRHLSVLGFCGLILSISVYLAVNVYGLKERIPFITSNVITIAQVLAALALYALYKYDSHRTDLWEELDDYVYYINGTCRLFEFIVISAVLCYRVADFSLEWTIFQIVMALLHVYFNIWTPAKEGWQSLKLRHLVNQKLNALPTATQEEIEDLQDVCAICLDELKVAKVTPCKHYFHTLCLRKWLNIQSKCPMCHCSIIPT